MRALKLFLMSLFIFSLLGQLSKTVAQPDALQNATDAARARIHKNQIDSDILLPDHDFWLPALWCRKVTYVKVIVQGSRDTRAVLRFDDYQTKKDGEGRPSVFPQHVAISKMHGGLSDQIRLLNLLGRSMHSFKDCQMMLVVHDLNNVKAFLQLPIEDKMVHFYWPAKANPRLSPGNRLIAKCLSTLRSERQRFVEKKEEISTLSRIWSWMRSVPLRKAATLAEIDRIIQRIWNIRDQPSEATNKLENAIFTGGKIRGVVSALQGEERRRFCDESCLKVLEDKILAHATKELLEVFFQEKSEYEGQDIEIVAPISQTFEDISATTAF